jgi:hypothetical protein
MNFFEPVFKLYVTLPGSAGSDVKFCPVLGSDYYDKSNDEVVQVISIKNCLLPALSL